MTSYIGHNFCYSRSETRTLNKFSARLKCISPFALENLPYRKQKLYETTKGIGVSNVPLEIVTLSLGKKKKKKYGRKYQSKFLSFSLPAQI